MNLDDILQPYFESARNLGSDILQDGTELIGRTPHVAPDARFHLVFPGLDSEQIEKIEHELGRHVPITYRQFLTRHNGLILYAGAISFYGFRRSYERRGDEAWQPFSIKTPNVDERPKDAEPSYFFIGSYKNDGSKLYIDDDTEKVYRSERWKSKNRLNEWTDFPTMLESEMERLSKLFNAEGEKNDPSKPTTPGTHENSRESGDNH